MRRVGKTAFTLIELLIVIAILGVLIGLLTGGVSGMWDNVRRVKCAQNLSTIWKANALWQDEEKKQRPISGGEWFQKLAPYVEEKADVFSCPAKQVWEGDADIPVFDGSKFAFDVYSSGSFDKFLWTVSIDSEWAKEVKVGDNEYIYNIEDQGYKGGGDKDFNDIRVRVWYSNGAPYKIKREQPGGHGYRFKLKINGKIVSENWDQEQGEIMLGNLWHPCDYGMSAGSWMNTERSDLPPDPAAFYILDYPKSVADYAVDMDPWDKYFIVDEDQWMARYGDQLDEDVSWRLYQSLRHDGQANVLFGDGNVRALGPDELYETNPRWVAGASRRAP